MFIVITSLIGLVIHFYRKFKTTSKVLEIKTGIKAEDISDKKRTELSENKKGYDSIVQDTIIPTETNQKDDEDLV